VGITPANVPEAAVTGDIGTDLAAAGLTLSELHIDRAYLASDLVRQRGDDLAIFCKAWRVRNTTGRYPKTKFTLDFTAGQLTCPAGLRMPFEPGKTVHFPKHACAACPLRHRCTASPSGRSVAIHPDEALLAELRQRQQTPPAARNSASAPRSSTPWPTSGTGKAAAPATAAPARTYSTCAASP
jgi:Transposase DDE domain